MIFAIIWEPEALNLATRFLADDPEGLHGLIEAIDALADEPRPQSAARLGSSDLYRLRQGRFRVVYEIDPESAIVRIRHIGHRT